MLTQPNINKNIIISEWMDDEKFMIGEWDEGWWRRCQTIEENEIDIIIQNHLMKEGNECENNHLILSKIKWNETIIVEIIDKKN